MENTMTLATGKMQFNVKSAKAFRDTLAKWHNADFELAVALDKKAKTVANIKGMIATDNELISKLEKGEVCHSTKSLDELKAEVTDFEARIKKESDTVAELRKVQKERLEGAYALLSKELHTAYVGFAKEEKRDEYVEALAKFFTDNGLTPTVDGINAFIACVGKKKATTRNKIANGKHNDAFSYNQWRDIFMGELCDVMGEALPIDKFIYQTMEERRKAWEEAKKNK
jgi:hypothetical protein